MLDALVVAPHPDDAELGMGGTIVRLIQQGWKVGILDLTSGEPTPLGSLERRGRGDRRGQRRAGQPLAQEPRPAQPEPRADAASNRRAVAAVFRQVRPRLLFAPYWEDAHPDHTAATKLVEDARFWSKLTKSDIPGEPFHPARIFYYFSVHLRIVERPEPGLDISDQLDAKVSGPAVLPLAACGQPARGPAGRHRVGLRPHPILGPVGRRPPCRAVRQPRADRTRRTRPVALADRSWLDCKLTAA